MDICLNNDVLSRVSTGLERYRLIHCALPEISLDDIKLSSSFLGKKLSYPIYISPITGGNNEAKRINRNLAAAAERYNIPICMGSMRAALEKEELKESFSVRKYAPNAMIFANMGAVQLNYGYSEKECNKLVRMIGADALVLHLNPLQEAIQPEGDTDFSGLLPKIKRIASGIDVPLIIKEVGHGISGAVCEALESAGISCIDVAGIGGTSWAAVEGFRSKNSLGERFRNWGNPTAECIIEARERTGLPLIASGGIRDGIDIVKALCLGANLCGIALPLLRPANESGECVEKYLDTLIKEIRIAMFCIGARDIKDLGRDKITLKL
ncbi:type 2 isopentenyl-diphosphate Delta-isomerase [Candidatus Woesearchaeota archaeon]|nr:type 2 isopentenyl-diphosphate Delta-isomerase [Candidatus Woesearchaeota archaeon]